MADDMIFWDEMWNQPSPNKKTPKPECCGDWDELGICNCKKHEDKN